MYLVSNQSLNLREACHELSAWNSLSWEHLLLLTAEEEDCTTMRETQTLGMGSSLRLIYLRIHGYDIDDITIEYKHWINNWLSLILYRCLLLQPNWWIVACYYLCMLLLRPIKPVQIYISFIQLIAKTHYSADNKN